ncbi:hypothetical protein BJF79_13015 [Actinomadura sp. CNU-125]|uniref:hypothetical protein n=1 Tax=Actinomadura sp. CNU-125 TaxID=1904961 RepID=UPI00095E8FA3|nr:hypothetical protein [Actinomadura sp. CNU-125]OLT25081.1 hypothetical protein BJF79_13015 [Actinomadura sp. CNU-125]
MVAPPGQASSWRERCPDCGETVEVSASQDFFLDEVHWHVQRQCTSCEFLTVACGVGETPDELRRLILAEHGPAVLTITGEPLGSLRTMKAVRDVLGVPFSEVRRSAERLRSDGVVGTLAEMERLGSRLEDAGLEIAVATG